MSGLSSPQCRHVDLNHECRPCPRRGAPSLEHAHRRSETQRHQLRQPRVSLVLAAVKQSRKCRKIIRFQHADTRAALFYARASYQTIAAKSVQRHLACMGPNASGSSSCAAQMVATTPSRVSQLCTAAGGAAVGRPTTQVTAPRMRMGHIAGASRLREEPRRAKEAQALPLAQALLALPALPTRRLLLRRICNEPRRTAQRLRQMRSRSRRSTSHSSWT